MRPDLPTALLAFLVLAPLSLVPAAQAGFFSEPLVIELPPLRVGDALRYEAATLLESPDERIEQAITYVFQVESRSTLPDRFGIPREVETILKQYVDNRSRAIERCHKLAGGLVAVQVEPLEGTPFYGQSAWNGLFLTAGSAAVTSLEVTTRFEPLWCMDPVMLPPLASVEEGRRYSVGALAWGQLGPPYSDVLSKPATEETFHGRRALRIAFDVKDFLEAEDPANPDLDKVEGSFSLLFAEGLPGLASYIVDVSGVGEGGRGRVLDRLDLAGFEAGEGAPLSRWANATLPGRHPEATFRAPDRLALDDAPFQPAYPYAEAFEALRNDMNAGLGSFLKANPDALLVSAVYDRHQTHPDYGTLFGTDGGWELVFQGGSGAYHATTVRAAPPSAASAPLPTLSPLVRNAGASAEPIRPSPALPAATADAATLARLAEAVGLRPAQVARVAYKVGVHFNPGSLLHEGATWTLSDHSAYEGEGEGRVVAFGAETGGLLYLADSKTKSEQVIPILQSPSDLSRGDGRLSAASFLMGPAVGAGLGVTGVAATSLALLVLLVKFLAFPLYTRLVRARLLEHPVRAALMQRAREAPGVRLAELVRSAGVAESAVRRHLGLLVKHGFLVELREGGTVSYYARGEVPAEAARQSALLRRPGTRDVYELLSREPGLSLREAGKRLGLSAPSVLRHRRMLEKAGLLKRGA